MSKRQVICRIILTYLLVLLPLLAVSSLVTRNLLRNVEQGKMDKINAQLDQVNQAIQEDFTSYTNKGVGLLQLKPFSRGQIMGDAIVQMESIELLQKLRLFDNRVNEILVYYGDEYLLGNNGIVSPLVFFQITMKCQANSIQQAMELLSSKEPGAIMLETVGSPYLMYHIPVGHDIMGRSRSVQYIFSISMIENMLDSYLETDGVLLKLTYGGVDVFFYNGASGCDYLTEDQAQAVFADMPGAVIESSQFGGGPEIHIWYSDFQQMDDYRQIRNVSLLILLVGVFLSAALSVSLSLGRMNSVSRLANNIVGKKISKPKRETWRRNEFDYIQALVDQSLKDSNEIKRNAKNYRFIILQQVAIMIFHGILQDRQEIQSLLSICGAELVEEYYYLCGIRLENSDDIKRLEPFVHEDLYYYDGNRLVVMLCQFPSTDYNMQKRKDVAQRLFSTLDSINIHCEQIVMSQVYNQISMANYAYLEITSTLEHSGDSGETILCWEDMVTQQDRHNFRFKNDNLQTFYGAVEQKNSRLAEKVLARIFQQGQRHEDEEYIRYMRYMVLQAMRLGSRSILEDADSPLQQQLDDLEGQETPEFVAGIKAAIKDYCQADSVYDKIVEYVNENFARCDLSLEQLAAKANISKAQMSKIFRAKTGTCYIDYVTNLRMEKARELLAETDLGIKEIFAQVGYIDSTNASKKFKTIYNITPSTYRAEKRKDSGKGSGNG